jgi:hypothetical protein
MPAKAGIQSDALQKMDSRLRGNDRIGWNDIIQMIQGTISSSPQSTPSTSGDNNG